MGAANPSSWHGWDDNQLAQPHLMCLRQSPRGLPDPGCQGLSFLPGQLQLLVFLMVSNAFRTWSIAESISLPPRSRWASRRKSATAARRYADEVPPVPAWDALALTSAARNRHVVSVLRANLP